MFGNRASTCGKGIVSTFAYSDTMFQQAYGHYIIKFQEINTLLREIKEETNRFVIKVILNLENICLIRFHDLTSDTIIL